MAVFIESLKISSSPYINALISVLAVVIIAKLADKILQMEDKERVFV